MIILALTKWIQMSATVKETRWVGGVSGFSTTVLVGPQTITTVLK